MKSFFEDLGKKIGETTETVTSKAGEMMEIQRLRGQIRTLERGNEADMLEMGRFLYEKYQAREAMDEQVQMLCEKIDNRTESIERHQAKIASARLQVLKPCRQLYAKVIRRRRWNLSWVLTRARWPVRCVKRLRRYAGVCLTTSMSRLYSVLIFRHSR